MRWKGYILLAVCAAFLLAGCKNNDYKGAPRLILTLSDATSDQYVSLVTSVTRVGLYDGTAWQYRDIDMLPFDVMLLTGYNNLTLIDSEMPEGHYSRLRIEFGENNKLWVADEKEGYELLSDADDLVWECDMDYEAVADRISVLSVDLDVNRSVSYFTDEDLYSFCPKNGCRLMDAQAEGAISGVMVNNGGAVITSLVQIKFCRGDSVLRSTYSNTENGRFFYRLSEGVYDVRFIPQSIAYDETLIDSVVVRSAEATSLGPVVLNNY